MWLEEQKRGWEEIIDIPFPAVDPTWELSKVEEVVEKNIKEMQYELSIVVAEPIRKRVSHTNNCSRRGRR